MHMTVTRQILHLGRVKEKTIRNIYEYSRCDIDAITSVLDISRACPPGFYQSITLPRSPAAGTP